MKKAILFIVAFAAFLSCAKENINQDNTANESIVTIFAEAPQSHLPNAESQQSAAQMPSTKTQLVDGTNVQWSPGDKIKMCFDAQTWNKNLVWSGVEFENTKSVVSESASFLGSVDVSKAGDYGFVVYPASLNFDSRTSGTYGQTTTTTVSYDLPSVQLAFENTFAPNLNLSYAAVTKKQVEANISNKTPISVNFKNMCSLIKITLPTQEYNVNQILIESANPLSGEYSMLWEASSTSQALKLKDYKSAVNEVVLINDDESNLTPGASYYAVVWPGSHNGLTFTFTDQEGKTCVKTLNKTVNCKVGKITEIKVSALEFTEAEPDLTVNALELSFAAAGENKSFVFNTNCSWTVTSDSPSWIIVSPESGVASKDDITVNVKCAENTQYQARTGNITISAGELTKTIKVTQVAATKPMYAFMSTINCAEDLANNTSYVVRLALKKQTPQNNYYVWSVEEDTGKLKVVYNQNVNETSGNAIEYNQVFVFEKVNSDPGVADSNYKSKTAGYLKCIETGKYLKSDMTFTANSRDEAQLLSFANKYGSDTTVDIDIYKQGTTDTLYQGDGGYMYTGYVNNYGGEVRKWIFQSVFRIN